MTRPSYRVRAVPIVRVPRGFTLAELLVVMGIIAIIASITVVAIKSISNDARLSSAVNTVTAGFDNARAIAIKKNKPVIAAFRVRQVEGEPQQTEMVIAEWSGASALLSQSNCGSQPLKVVDRFEVVADVPPRRLPEGIKVASAWYDRAAFDPDFDRTWFTLPEFVRQPNGTIAAENPEGRMMGIMFAGDGSVVTSNFRSNSDLIFIDFDRDGFRSASTGSGPCEGPYWDYDELTDEPNIEPVPFVAVFDDKAAREIKILDWANVSAYQSELTGPNGYISTFANRIHFNRYTGVAMR